MRQLALLRAPLVVGLASSFVLAACASSPSPVVSEAPSESTPQEPSFEELSRELPNGLHVIVRKDLRSPLVAVVTRVGAGYLNEEDDELGISHLLEHMILQGTEDHPGDGEMAGRIRELGGRFNGATSYDHTESWMVLPSTELETAITFAGEIYREPLLDPGLMDREKERVRQEILRKLEDPKAFARDAMLQLVFSRNRLGRGEQESLAILDTITREQLIRFHLDHYRPANTTVTVVGDVDPEAAFALIETAFAGVDRGELRLHRGGDESEQEGLHYEAHQGEYDPNLVVLGFPLPGEGHSDLPALELLAVILVDGEASRMRIPLEKRADRVFGLESQVARYEGGGLMEIVIAASNKFEDQALRTFFVELERVVRFGVSETELDGARRGLATRWREGQQGMLSQARALASIASVKGTPSPEGPARWSAVESADLQRVAKRWLSISRASIVLLADQDLMSARPFYAQLDGASMQEHLEGAVLAATTGLEPFVLPSPPPTIHSRLELAGWSRAFDVPEAGTKGRLQRMEFANGTAVIVQEDASLPSVYVSIWFRGGRVAEVPNSAGSTALLQKLMRFRSLNRPPESLARELDGLGTRIEELRRLDGFGFGSEVHRGEFPYIFDILYDLVANPRFDALEIERAKQRQYRQIMEYDRRLYARSGQLLRQAAWPGHGYALPEYGDRQTVNLARSDRLEELQIETCDPSNAVIVIAGAVDAELVMEFLELYMDRWSDLSDLFPAGADAFFASEFIDPLAPFEDGAEAEVYRSSALGALQLGFLAPGPRDPANAGVEVLAAWLDTPGGELWRTLQEEGEPLLLALRTEGGALGSLISAYLVSEASELSATEDALLRALRGVASITPSQEQASQAAAWVAAEHRLSHESLSARAHWLANQEILGFTPETTESRAQDLQGVDAVDLGTLLQTIILDGAHAVGRMQGTQVSPE